MKVAFRVDASSEIGTGHVMRCLTLADELARRGSKTWLIMRALPGHLGELARGRGHDSVLLPAPTQESVAPLGPPVHAPWLSVPAAQDAGETLAALGAGGFDWLIVDHYALDADWQRRLRRGASKILVIDDLADRPHDCDILLDTTQEGAERYRELLPAQCLRLLGPRFALLRPQFAAARSSQRDGSVKRIHVFYGGSDPNNLTELTLQAIAQVAPSLAVDVVLGQNVPPAQRERLERSAAQLAQASTYTDVSDMAGLMARADLAFGAAGVTTWERACLGLPSLVVTVAENQRKLAATAEQSGIVRWLGDVKEITVEKLTQALRAALAAPAALAAQSRRALELVDGGGASRVGAALVGEP